MRPLPIALAGVAGLGLAHAAWAQAAKSQDTVLLSAFTVKESADRGYIASESITGTRVATPIKDLPFSVSVTRASS